MTFRTEPCSPADQADKVIARLFTRRIRTRVIAATGPIHLTCRNTGEPDPWTFSTPDWSVTIPYTRRGTGECLTGGNNLSDPRQTVQRITGIGLAIAGLALFV